MKLLQALESIEDATIQQSAINNIAGPESRRDIEVTDVADALRKAFLWRATPQGSRYWTGIVAKLDAGETLVSPTPAVAEVKTPEPEPMTPLPLIPREQRGGLESTTHHSIDPRAVAAGVPLDAALELPPAGYQWSYRGTRWDNGGRPTMCYLTYNAVSNYSGCSATNGTPCGFSGLHYFEAIPAHHPVDLPAHLPVMPLPPEGFEWKYAGVAVDGLVDYVAYSEERPYNGWGAVARNGNFPPSRGLRTYHYCSLHPVSCALDPVPVVWAPAIEMPTTTPTIVLEEGKRYVTRSGEITSEGVTELEHGNTIFFVSSHGYYDPDGTWRQFDRDMPHRNDIVAEYVEPLPEPPPEIVIAEPTPLVIEDGKWYRRRDGEVVQVAYATRTGDVWWVWRAGDWTYDVNGNFFDTPNVLDLIAEVPNPNE